jgi:hypothetical protein
MRGLLLFFAKYSRTRNGIYLETPRKNICPFEGVPNISILWPRTDLEYIIQGKHRCLSAVKTHISLPYARARAFSLFSMQPKWISKAAEGSEEKNNSVLA